METERMPNETEMLQMAHEEIDELKSENDRLREAIGQQQETADARQCPCRLHFKHAVPEVFEDQEAKNESQNAM